MSIRMYKPKRADIEKCVARFKDLTRNPGGLPDADLEGYRRTFMNVLGFKPPERAAGDDRTVSPVPENMKAHITHLQPGFGLAFVEVEAGQGVMMHVHDTNESFVIIDGRWRMTWEGEEGNESIDLGPLDTISFPPNIQRQFHVLTAPQGKKAALMLGIIGGDQPAAEYSPESVKLLVAAGKMAA